MACLIFKVSQTCYRYKARLDEENQQIAEWLIQLTNDHKTWGFKLCFLYLRNVKNTNGTTNVSIAFIRSLSLI